MVGRVREARGEPLRRTLQSAFVLLVLAIWIDRFELIEPADEQVTKPFAPAELLDAVRDTRQVAP